MNVLTILHSLCDCAPKRVVCRCYARVQVVQIYGLCSRQSLRLNNTQSLRLCHNARRLPMLRRGWGYSNSVSATHPFHSLCNCATMRVVCRCYAEGGSTQYYGVFSRQSLQLTLHSARRLPMLRNCVTMRVVCRCYAEGESTQTLYQPCASSADATQRAKNYSNTTSVPQCASSADATHSGISSSYFSHRFVCRNDASRRMRLNLI